MAYSTDITTALAGLQNQNPDYFSQVKGILLNIGSALTALGQTSGATTVNSFANGNPIENILRWCDLKPVLVQVQVALAAEGATVTDLNALLQPIPTGDGAVYSDQLKPVMTEIADLLAGLGQ